MRMSLTCLQNRGYIRNLTFCFTLARDILTMGHINFPRTFHGHPQKDPKSEASTTNHP